MTAARHASFLTDSPVGKPDADRFGRWPFARQVASVIAKRTDPGSLTIGLYGEWGEGKTSVLNLVAWELQESHKDRVSVISFNPWRFSNEEEMLYIFFDSLASALGTTLNETQDVAGKVAAGASHVAGIFSEGLGSALKSAGTALRKSIDQCKARINKILEAKGRTVVVIMDDVDRLEISEIQSLFRLVKLSGDLSHTVYLMALDEEVVAQALSERYGKDVLAGRRFLEKIVQVPLRIPAVTRASLERYCDEGIQSALDESSLHPTQREVEEFSRTFHSGLLPAIRTPRLAKRYTNALRFSLSRGDS